MLFPACQLAKPIFQPSIFMHHTVTSWLKEHSDHNAISTNVVCASSDNCKYLQQKLSFLCWICAENVQISLVSPSLNTWRRRMFHCGYKDVIDCNKILQDNNKFIQAQTKSWWQSLAPFFNKSNWLFSLGHMLPNIARCTTSAFFFTVITMHCFGKVWRDVNLFWRSNAGLPILIHLDFHAFSLCLILCTVKCNIAFN